MKKGFLRCIAVIMVVFMAAVYVPMADISDLFAVEASARTYSGKLGGNVTWSYDTDSRTITVSGSGNMKDFKNGDDGQGWTTYRVLGMNSTIVKHARTIDIKSGVTNIGNNAFRGITGVTKVNIASSVTSIGASAFEGCSALSSVVLPSNLKSIGANAFKNTKFANVTMPDTVTSISSNSFAGVSGLKIICNYNTDAYNCLVKNSMQFSFPENKLFIDAKLDAANKQVLVNLKMIYNKAEFNAGNFNLTYNGSVSPVSTETAIKSENGITLAAVHHAGKVSFAMMAEKFVPLSTNCGVSVYDFGTIAFAINGQADTAEFGFAADVLMMNNAKTSIKQASANVGLHVFADKVVKEPDCKNPGLKANECSVCGKKTETPIPADTSKHGETEVRNKKDATCKDAGYTGDTICKVCGVTVKKGSDVPATGKHNYEVAVTEATCVKGGYTTYTCKVCGHSYVGDETEKAAHDYEKVVTEATCTASGFTTYTCKVCADSYKGDFAAELGHDFGADGKCSRCDETTVVSVTFTDNTGITVDDEKKVVFIRKTLKSEELKANIASGNWAVTDAEGTVLAEGKAVATGNLIKSETTDLTYTVIIIGDVNSDGRITASDARSVLRVASRLDKSNDMFNLAADCDGKVKITASDARVILRVASRLQSF